MSDASPQAYRLTKRLTLLCRAVWKGKETQSSSALLGDNSRQPQQSRFELGRVSPIDCKGRTTFVADAHRDDGNRFVVRGDEKLTALLSWKV
jgi:hypothetical protein